MNQQEQLAYTKSVFQTKNDQIDPNKYFENQVYKDLLGDLNINNDQSQGYDMFSSSYQVYNSNNCNNYQLEDTPYSQQQIYNNNVYNNQYDNSSNIFEQPQQSCCNGETDSFGSASKMSISSNGSNSYYQHQQPLSQNYMNQQQKLHLSAPKKNRKKKKVYLESHINKIMDQPYDGECEMFRKMMSMESIQLEHFQEQ